ncbi:hypothetical protein OPV22_032065 [Ensete ventricosum]|uniref:Uncharacterized protein n=1 Tax=Ensete ventricosum TaxID=4639 RepID=A0AAV8PQQ5_ENSVE|nr:hypothetical protein OPV22_032065 [Ensete ventricosum]
MPKQGHCTAPVHLDVKVLPEKAFKICLWFCRKEDDTSTRNIIILLGLNVGWNLCVHKHIIPSPPPQRTAVTANHSHPYIYKTPSHLPLFPQACKREEEELTNPSSSSLLPSSGGGAAPARLSRRPPPTMEMKKIACAVLVAAASATAAFAAEAPAPSPASDSFAVAPAVGAVLGASLLSFFAFYLQ